MVLSLQIAKYKRFDRNLTGTAYDKALARMDWWQRFDFHHGPEKTRELYLAIYGKND